MKKFTTFHFGLLAMAAGILCASCSTDGNYDLDNIDSTARISVNNLTVPINIDPVTMETALDIDDDSDIKKDTIYESDGRTIKEIQYVVKKDGTFTADGFSVETSTIDFSHTTDGNVKMAQVAARKASGNIPVTTIETKISDKPVDEAVQSIDTIGFDKTYNVKMTMQLKGMRSDDDVTLSGVKITTIKGLKVKSPTATKGSCTYDPVEGKVTAEGSAVWNSTTGYQEFTVTLPISEIDNTKAGIAIDSKHSLSYNKQSILTEGKVNLVRTVSTLPSSIAYTINSTMPTSTINRFTGKIYKEMEVSQIDPINLSSLPDVLKQAGTSIELVGARLNIDVNNPVLQKRPEYKMNVAVANITLNGNASVGPLSSEAINLTKAQNDIELSASDQGTASQWVKYEGINKVVAGNKTTESIPESITIKIAKPTIDQKISNFILGESFGDVQGTWKFFTPLEMTDQSLIKYNKDWDTWDSDDMQYLTIENGVLNLDLLNSTPLAIESVDFTLYNIDMTKQLRGTYDQEIKSGQTQSIKIPLSGDVPVDNIKGGILNCHVKGGLTKGQEKSLQPDQTLEVSNVKMTVNGFYQKKF